MSKKLYNNRKPSWYSSCRSILDILGAKPTEVATKNSHFKSSMKKLLFSNFIDRWEIDNLTNSSGKLRSYTIFKSNFGREKYLSILHNFEQRRSLTKLRISAHQLRIETGRYQGTLPQDRLCTKCDSGKVEDECHFLFDCAKHNDDRKILENLIYKNCPNFSKLNEKDKLIWLMNTEDKAILIAVSNFITKNCN